MSTSELDLRNKIKVLSQHVWEGRADNPDVESWLAQFSYSDNPEENERLQMLFLLSNFVYFGVQQVRELLKSLYRDHYRYKMISEIRRANGDTIEHNFIKEQFRHSLNETRFMGVGNPSESGCHLLYYFRQENNLPKTLFMHQFEIFGRSADGRATIRNPSVKNYVFIDDLCGSGHQASSYSASIVQPLKELMPDAKVHYHVLFAMSSGIEYVKKLGIFDQVSAVVELDESFRCFSEDSRFYKNETPPIDRLRAKAIAEAYGARLLPGHPLGYSDCQLLLGFSHNTPDNTVPVFWADMDSGGKRWHPVFHRYAKDYGWGL